MYGGPSYTEKSWQFRRTANTAVEPVRMLKLLRQKQHGKLPSCSENNQEIAIDFAGPFQNAIIARKFLLVFIDHFSGCTLAKHFVSAENPKGHFDWKHFGEKSRMVQKKTKAYFCKHINICLVQTPCTPASRTSENPR